MKICLISPFYDPWLIGGAERYITHLGNALARDHELIVVTTIGKQPRVVTSSNNNPRIIEINPGNIFSPYEVITRSSVSPMSKLIWHIIDVWNPFVYSCIKQLLRHEKPDIVHTNGVKGLSASLFSAIKKSNIPNVHTMHDYELLSRWSSLFRNGAPIERFNAIEKIYMSLMKRISSSIDGVISPSKFLLGKHLEHGFFSKTSRYVIPNGNMIRHDTLRKKFSREFLYIGQLTENKGVHIAIAAFKKVRFSDAKFHIIGDGRYMPRLKELASDDNRIKIYGYIQNQSAVDEIIKECSYFVFPSIWYENYPLVLNELMSHGLPVIASNIGGVPEIINHGHNGFLVTPNSIEELRAIFEEVMSSENLISKLSDNAILSSKMFPLHKHVEKIVEVYNIHINNRGNQY